MWALDKLVIKRGIKVTLILERRVLVMLILLNLALVGTWMVVLELGVATLH